MPDRPAVSVVVPVFAPGPYVRPLLDSLDRQVPPDGGFEAVFADDGSTDATADLLESWAADRPWARVIRLPNSGWPSHPRNIGIESARGDFVFFVDHDDWLAPDALATMTAFARESGADVVIGRMSGLGRNVPVKLFARTVADARPPETPLQSSMTVHAMFRREFLLETGLRFDETLRRLEDHVFMATAYTRAARISVLADRPVYLHASRKDSANAGHRPYGASEYYAALARAIDIVLASTRPELERNAYLGRWIRREMIDRLRSDAVRWLPAAERETFFAEVQTLLRERTPLDALRALGSEHRWPAALARTATADEFWRADDVVTGSTRAALAGRPGTRALAGAVDAATLERATEMLGDDPPLPPRRAAASARALRLRRARAGLVRGVAAIGAGRYQRRVVAWARSPSKLLREAGAVVAPVCAVVAAVLAASGSAPVAAFALVTAAAAVTAWLSVRSLSGLPTAVRQALLVVPTIAVALRTGDTVLGGPAVAALALIALALVADRRWRRREVRAYPARAGGPLSRLGWIGATATTVSAVTAALAAWALLAR